MKATPVQRSLDSLVNNIVKELNQAILDSDTKGTNESAQRVRELREAFQRALELADFYKNITSK